MEKGGLATALTTAGVTQETRLAWGDEMRVGLCGHIRRVWAPRGVKVQQRLQMERVWRYLALAVDGLQGTLTWHWIASMKGPAVAEAVQHWRDEGIETVVWDRARSHNAPPVREVGLTLIQQPPYAPELNPAELVFEGLRNKTEGRVYATIEEKVAAVDQALRELAAHPEQVKRLAGWQWIRDAYEQLPQKVVVP